MQNDIEYLAEIKTALEEGNFLTIAKLTLQKGIAEYKTIENADMQNVLDKMQEALELLQQA